MASSRPFSRYEFLIAWRYLRARRAEGGVSVMTWISLIGIMLGVAALIATLAAQSAQVDSTLLFVSDHGESLGERNLFLHGVPHAIAPREQTQVPMVMWWSTGLGDGMSLNAECMRARAARPAQHDHLFHTLLTLLDVRSALYEPTLDLTRGCHAEH